MRVLIAVALLVSATEARATGWNDYALPIAPGYTIYRMNSFEVCLGRSDQRVLICPDDVSTFGPIAEYAQTPTHIFTRHHGARPCPENSAMPCEDPAQSFFFILEKASGSYEGPLERAAFDGRLRVLGSPRLTWVTPENPNVLRPLIGALMFLTIAVFLIGWPLGVPGWPVGAGFVIYLVWRRCRWRPRGFRPGGRAG